MIKKILFLLSCSLGLLAQPRDNRPLPLFNQLPYLQIGDSIVGWSYSSDGQWLSKAQTIPAIGISRNEKFYEADHNLFGVDNIYQLRAYRVKWGTDTMICFLKLYRDGAYRYPSRMRGWRDFLSAYYIIVEYKDLKAALDYFKEQGVQEDPSVLRIRAYDSKELGEVKEKEALERVIASTVLRPSYDRNLVLTLQRVEKSEMVRFHFCSLHEIFNDVEGVRQPFNRAGRSVYGSEQLFDFIFFELKEKDLYQVLNLKRVSEDGSLESGDNALSEEPYSQDFEEDFSWDDDSEDEEDLE